jgi:O-antigen ligase
LSNYASSVERFGRRAAARRPRLPALGWPAILRIGVIGVVAGLLGAVTAVSPLASVGVIALGGLIAVAVVRPVWAIGLALLLIPLETLQVGVQNVAITATEVVLLVAAAGWLLQRTLRGGASLRTPLTPPLVALLLAHIPLLLVAADRFAVAKQLTMWTACFVVFLAVVSDEGRNTSKTLAGLVATSGALVAAVAIAKSAGSQQIVADAGGIVTNRATGSFASPVLLAIFVAVAVPLQLVFMLTARSRLVQLGGLAAVALSLLALALALTRGVFVALAAGALWMLATWRPARRLGAGLAVVLALVVTTGVNPVASVVNRETVAQRVSSITSLQSRSAELRLEIWEETPRIFVENLPFGIGPKNLPMRAAEYGLVFPVGAPSNAHNTVLVVATELGIPGVAILVWLVVALVKVLRRSLQLRVQSARALAVGLTASALILGVDGITDYAYGANPFFLTVIVLAGVAARLERSAREQAEGEHQRTVPERELATA